MQETACGTIYATVLSGGHQTISISTSPVEGAECHLENDKGKWRIESTPSYIVIQKSEKDLIIVSNKKGYKKGVSKIKATLNNTAYGNIALGGMIGASIDRSNGSAFQYPTRVTIPLS